MKLVIQRVNIASVTINGGETRSIGRGLCVLFGAGAGDGAELIPKLAEKTAKLRIFSDGEGKMNLSALELGLEVLVVPQFTLFADTKKGNRPSFTGAAEPEFAKNAFESYCAELEKYSLKKLERGEFGAHMLVSLENDGPVTIIMDTREWQRNA
ncbi:MAG: D-aminoacyl-tRNA deacylase [Oscillospiraceae bacterium]|nr:D-aminoacyl-tRNA deacylase [Oscillospiraceae bacterium]